MKKVFIITLIVAILFVIFAMILKLTNNENPTACTDEAKICPDGSAVGRSGPDCEFTPCSGE